MAEGLVAAGLALRFVGYDGCVTNDSHVPDLESVRKVQEVLRTWRRVEPDAGDEKLMSYMLQGAGADLEVTARALTIRYDWNPCRHRYVTNAAPGIVSKLLEWCKARVVTAPRAFRFPGTLVPRSGLFWELIERSEAFDVWFFPDDAVKVMVRRSRLDAERPLADAPPPPIRFEYRNVNLAQSIACPHCGHVSDSYRDLSGAWLCSKCARSFPVGPRAVATGRER